MVHKETICVYTEIEYTYDDKNILVGKRLVRSWQSLYGASKKTKPPKKEAQEMLVEEGEELLL